jgi:tetratricopeptide (TPR) repeat protein
MINTQKLVVKTSSLFRFGKFEEAQKLLASTLKEDPNCFEARLEQIRAALFQDKIGNAFQLIDEVAAIYPQDSRLAALQGIWFLENQEYRGAEAALSWAAKTLPKDANIHLNLAIALRNLGEIQKAEEQVLKSLLFNPASELAHFEYARILMLQNQPQEAVLQILKALECNIYFIPGLIAITQYLRMKSDLDAAILLYKDALRIAPDFDFLYGQLAIIYEEKGDYAAALPYAQHLAKTSASYYDDLRVGIYTFLSGNAIDAEEIFLKCIQRDANKWEAYYNLGQIYFTKGKLDEAQTQYQKAVDLVDSMDSKPFNQLGIICLSKDNLQEAEAYFQKAIAINPKAFDPAFNMALTCKQRGDLLTSKEWAKKAFLLARDNVVQKYAAQKLC